MCVFPFFNLDLTDSVCLYRGDGMGRGQEREGCRTGNCTFGCICKSSVKMIIEKVLIDRRNFNRNISLPLFYFCIYFLFFFIFLYSQILCLKIVI
jgi:hypothetical protein